MLPLNHPPRQALLIYAKRLLIFLAVVVANLVLLALYVLARVLSG